jgi:hypothetical protein
MIVSNAIEPLIFTDIALSLKKFLFAGTDTDPAFTFL